MLTVLHLCFVLFALTPCTFGLCCIKLSEVAFIKVETLGVLVDNIGCNGVEERSVV